MSISLRKAQLAGAVAAFIAAGVLAPAVAAADPPPPPGYNGYGSFEDAHQAWQDCVHHKTGDTVAGALIGGTLGAVVGGAATGRGGGAAVGAGIGGVSGAAIGSSSVDCGPEPVAGGYYDQGGDYGGPGYANPGPQPGYYDNGSGPDDRGYYDDRGSYNDRGADQGCAWARATVYNPDGSVLNTRIRVCRDETGHWQPVD